MRSRTSCDSCDRNYTDKMGYQRFWATDHRTELMRTWLRFLPAYDGRTHLCICRDWKPLHDTPRGKAEVGSIESTQAFVPLQEVQRQFPWGWRRTERCGSRLDENEVTDRHLPPPSSAVLFPQLLLLLLFHLLLLRVLIQWFLCSVKMHRVLNVWCLKTKTVCPFIVNTYCP